MTQDEVAPSPMSGPRSSKKKKKSTSKWMPQCAVFECQARQALLVECGLKGLGEDLRICADCKLHNEAGAVDFVCSPSSRGLHRVWLRYQ